MIHSGVTAGMRNTMQDVEAGGNMPSGTNAENAFSDKAVSGPLIQLAN